MLAIWVKDITGSNAAAGLTILAIAAPSVVAPFVGFLVNRARRRPFLLWTNLVAALIVLPLLAVGDEGPVWVIYLVAAGYGCFVVLHRAALSGLLQEMLPATMLGEGELAAAIGADGDAVGRSAGRRGAVGRIRRGHGRLSGRGDVRGRRGDAGAAASAGGAAGLGAQRLRTEMAAGARFLFGEPALRRVVVVLGVALLLIGPIETAYFAVVDEGLRRAPSFIGVLLSVEGVGAVVGALSAPRIMRGLGEQRLVAGGLLLVGVGVILLIPPSLLAVVAGSVSFGLGLPWIMIGYATLLQRRTPRPLMGRGVDGGRSDPRHSQHAVHRCRRPADRTVPPARSGGGRGARPHSFGRGASGRLGFWP